MRTPDGRACPYYYVNHHRRSTPEETCHLLEGKPDARRWTSALCATCPVPDIHRANRCPHMVLHGHIGRRRWRFWEQERVLIRATCPKSDGPVKDPYRGCGHCHDPLTFIVREKPDTYPNEE